jgi:hypothetical protein
MTYRTGNHWGVTIVRQGERTPEGHIVGTDQLVAVVVNGDQALAERICALLNAEPCRDRVTGLHLDPCTCRPAAADSCTCGHDGLADMFHTRPCPIAERRFIRLRNTEDGA